MRQPLRQGAALAAVAAALVAILPALRADDQAKSSSSKDDKNPAEAVKAQAKDQMASGVIVRVQSVPTESAEKGERKDHQRIRLLVNTDVVWLDWARDQAKPADKADEPPAEAAKEGSRSVATRGQPKSANTEVAVDLSAETRVETRYRSDQNEGGEGAKTPAEAAPKADRPGGDASKAKSYTLEDLKPGLFVEVHYLHRNAQNAASRIIVMRPVRTPSAEGQPDARKEK